ncbi:TonB-dependent receptor [Formosa haliotis]|uniref:TonB-dependent receptor n=1 Tax=Formosa haliotis TaxID=1555194 RepID=UPI000A66318A|nr:TonB-dependent receptor [Formosa haliotis]
MKQILIALVFLTTMFSYAQQTTGSIVGTLTDKEYNNEPLAFANILIKGTTKGTTSDMDGNYSFENLEAGSYSLLYSFVGYETQEVPVTVTAGKETKVDIIMGASAAALDEVVITTTTNKESETALLLEQKKAVEIKQSIGTDELVRKAVTNVEQGLTKISGITTVQDRGIFVRGLDDRYNFLLVNGLPLASSDPDNKIIPLGYIATSIVGSVDVLKTFNSSIYQDFAGATFEINTKQIPSKPQTKFSVGFGLNTNTSLKSFKTDDSGDSEFFGYTGGGRHLPSQWGQDAQLGYTASPSESATIFDTSWTPTTTKAPLSTRFGLSHGQEIFDNGVSKVGFYFSLDYRNSYLTQQGVERALNSEGTAQQDFTTTNFNFSTQKSGLLGLNFSRGNNFSLNFNTIYLQNSSNFIREAQGLNDGFTQLNNKDFYIRDIKYTENDLLSFQLFGDKSWNNDKHILTFAGSYGIGNNNLPDRRVLRTAGSGEEAEYITTNGIDPFKFYQELNNNNINAKVEYQVGFQRDEDSDKFKSILKVGYNFDDIRYDFFNRTISTEQNSKDPLPYINTNDPQDFFEQGFAGGYLFYSNTADPAAKSKINQTINAAYIDFTKEWDKLLVEVGIRGEAAFREIIYREQLSSINDPYKSIEYNPFDIAPSLNIKYTLNDLSNIRFAGSKTVTRPRLREILPTTFQDGDGNQVLGNPEVENSTNYNADLKYEIFPSRSEVLALTVFGKYIQNPIERLSRSTSIGYRTFFDNFDEAYIYGLELEAKVNIGSITKLESLNPFTFGFNGILMDSEASADPNNPDFATVTNKTRKLQGASDWGVNADLGYNLIDREETTSSINLIFNTYGKRIYAVGVEGADEIYEKPVNQLDLSWNTQFNEKFGLRFTVRNILNEETLFTQDATREIQFPDDYSNVIENFNLGVNFSLNLTYQL